MSPHNSAGYMHWIPAVPASEESKRDIIQGWNYHMVANQPLFSRFSYTVN
ncbi:hypothetical protein [Alteromonas sp. 76-1]|nr:hypothetical protein [Alteromonas sp. 76-1]